MPVFKYESGFFYSQYMKKKKNGIIKIVLLVALVSVVGLAISNKSDRSGVVDRIADEQIKEEIVVYKSPNCGCCGNYAKYLSKEGFNVKVVNEIDMTTIKEKYNIPVDLESCHTTVVGDYVVEGHIPVEGIAKLMTEKPDIKGIAMPNMPSGSPGMPGPKQGPFVVYELTEDGSKIEFARL